MKKSNFLKSLIALSCCLTMGLGALTGCGGEPECEHVYTLVNTVESTCAQAGKQTFRCGICGDIKEETLPLDENKHVFTGDWAITKPTEEADGLAVKTCANNPEHKVEITLPKVTISAKGYDQKEFITVPTTAREGEIKLTLENRYGDITFNVNLAKRKLNNMEDAVILASSLKENVRKADGWMQEAKDGLKQNFSYDFGDDYTHIKDEINNKESWYSLDDDGNVFAMSKIDGSSTATVDPTPDAGFLNGFFYNSTVNASTFYGAEAGLAQLYETAMNGMSGGNFEDVGTTINYKEISKSELNSAEHKGKDGSLNDLWFSFSHYASGWFARFKVVFSTYPDGTLKELEVETEVIRPYMYVTDIYGSIVTYKESDESVKNGKAVAGDIIFAYEYPTNAVGLPSYQYDNSGNLVYEQINKKTGNPVYFDATGYYDVVGKQETEDAEGNIIYLSKKVKLDYVPELEPVYIKDKFGMTVLDDKGNPIPKIMASGGYPIDSWYSDTHKEVSYKTVHIEQTKKVTQEEIDSGLRDPEVVPENPYPYDSLYIKNFDITGATVAGATVDISGGLSFPTNKVVKLSLGNITPSTATLNSDAIENIYIKDATGTFIKLKFDFNNGSQYKVLSFFTLSDGTLTINSQYAGSLTFVFETKSGKCKKEVEMTFTKSAPTSLTASAEVYTVVDGVVVYKESGVSIDKPVNLIVGQELVFKAVASSVEAAYVSTDIYPTCSSSAITFKQNEEGSYKDWKLVASAAGEYTITMPYYDGEASSTVKAQFKVIVSAKPDTMSMLSGNTFKGNVLMARSVGNPVSRELTAQFTTQEVVNEETGNTETINVIIINVSGNEIVYTYGVDGSGKLTTQWKSGLDQSVKSYDFSFSINEAGDLVISHSTGMGNETEEKVLTKVVAEEGQV